MSNKSKLDAIFKKLAQQHGKLNVNQQAFAIKEIGRVRGDIVDLLADYAGKDGTVKKTRLNRLLRELDDIEALIREYGTTALDTILKNTAEWTSSSINEGMLGVIGVRAVAKAQMRQLNSDVFEYVVKRFGDDGLVLSDRVWRLAGDMRDDISKVLRSDIIKGESVNTMIANVRKVHDNETWKIRRLVVTEGNTTYRTATAYNAERSDVVTGVKLHHGKANDPKHRCTILSHEDRYGMGAGVFKPTDYEIYNPHPNCTSFITYELDEKYL